ncbi:MAG: PAS domain S-box protein [Chlorobi bacterium]|nr:PAS domain S-box protein [Chlorobiota bacterium]
MEYRFRRKDGEVIWISDVKSFEFDPEGEVSHVNGIIRDVSRYKMVELQLRDSEEHFRMMFESSPDGLAIFDLPITRFMCNHQFSQMFGYEQHELQDSPWQKLMRVPDNAVHGRMDRLMREGNIDFNAILFTKLGKVLYCNVRCSRFHTSHGPRYCAVVRDMTDRRTLEFQLQQYSQKLEKLVEERTQELTYYSEKLEQLVSERTAKLEAMNKELEQFAYTISHDLRAPLIAIEGFTELLKDELADALTDESAEWMNIIVNSVQRMNHLISDVLELARIGRVVGEKVEVNLNQVIDSIKQEFQIRMEERHVTISVPEPLPVIKTDLQRMRQVFQNLISNAIKYNNKENIEVAITAEKRDDNMVEIVVRDNGIGIPEASQKEIFLLFRRLQTGDEEDSTGAGLAIVKKIINSLGGEIWVESTVGEGSAFHFTLPLKAE